MSHRNIGQPDREIFNLFIALNEEQRNHDIVGLYQGRLRSHQSNFESIKRKWEAFTGVPIPKRLKPSSDVAIEVERPVPTLENSKVKHTEGFDLETLNYHDIRKELKKRGLDTRGKKVDLQERLGQHLKENRERKENLNAQKVVMIETAENREEHTVVDSSNLKGAEVRDMGYQHGLNATDQLEVIIENVSDNNNSSKLESTEEISHLQPIKPESTSINSTEEIKSSDCANTKQTPAPKSALKPSKYNIAVLQKSPIFLKQASKNNQSAAKDELTESNNLDTLTKLSESSDSSNSNSSSSFKSTTSVLSSSAKTLVSSHPQTTPNCSYLKNLNASAGSSAKLLEKKKAMAEASESRKAKIAEMRVKAKNGNVGGVTSSKLAYPNSKGAASNLKAMATSSNGSGESKANLVLAKMREKVAAEKAGDTALVSSQANEEMKANMVGTASFTASVSLMPKADPQIQLNEAALGSTLKSVPEYPNKGEERKEIEKPLSPLQTYDISDRDEDSESDEESDEDSNQGSKKTIPDWAQKANLHIALQKQFAEGPNRLDPDKIFGEVLTCNLEQIFGDIKSKKRYNKRTSSGNWSKDHVTLAEKLSYRQIMGYHK